MQLEPCPCCLGKSELVDMQVGGRKMWQISCSHCGMSSELDDDKGFTVQNWNRRKERDRLRTWVTALAALLPFVGIMAFLIGSYLGLTTLPK